MLRLVHFAMCVVIALLSASTGSEGFAKKAMTVNFCMNTTCQRCRSVISFQSLVSRSKVIDFVALSFDIGPFLPLFKSSIKIPITICIISGQCGNKECPFLHIDPEKKMKECAWYDRGYCRHGRLYLL